MPLNDLDLPQIAVHEPQRRAVGAVLEHVVEYDVCGQATDESSPPWRCPMHRYHPLLCRARPTKTKTYRHEGNVHATHKRHCEQQEWYTTNCASPRLIVGVIVRQTARSPIVSSQNERLALSGSSTNECPKSSSERRSALAKSSNSGSSSTTARPPSAKAIRSASKPAVHLVGTKPLEHRVLLFLVQVERLGALH